MKMYNEMHSNHKLFLLRSVHLLITLGETLACRSQYKSYFVITSMRCMRIGSINGKNKILFVRMRHHLTVSRRERDHSPQTT